MDSIPENKSTRNDSEDFVTAPSERKYIVLFSGGRDSSTLLHYLQSKKAVSRILFIDTDIRSQALIDWIKTLPYEIEIYDTPIRFEWIVKRFGFARPHSHSWYFRYLKERAIDLFIKDYEKKEELIFASGVRKAESRRRFNNTKAVSTIGSHKKPVYAPIMDWTNEQVSDYIRKNNICISPCYKNIGHGAGDCRCGAYAERDEMPLLEAFEPETAERIHKLEDLVGGVWGNPKMPRFREKGQSVICECNQA